MKKITTLRKMTFEELRQELKNTRPEIYASHGMTACHKCTLIQLITGNKYTR